MCIIISLKNLEDRDIYLCSTGQEVEVLGMKSFVIHSIITKIWLHTHLHTQSPNSSDSKVLTQTQYLFHPLEVKIWITH